MKVGWVTALFFLVALAGIAQGAYPPPVDISVSKEAQVNGISVQEVNPGEMFYYNITVENDDPNYDAPEVVVTDKLPYDVVYVETNVYPALPADYTIHKTGDLLYVKFEEIPKASVRYVNITVVAPSQAPTTLYDIVNVRYANDPDTSDNSMTIATYVPLVGYDQTAAVKSFEDLLHNQSQLLFDFEDLLHEIPEGPEENYTFIASFEQLLRAQANLTHSFEDLLSNETQDGWDTYYTPEERAELLDSFEAMLWDEAFLFSSFEMKLKDAWESLCNGYTADGHTQDAQTEFIASFEDLLKEQTKLFKSYNLLFKKLGDDVSHEDQAEFLAAYENLLRVEANLLMSFEDLLKMKYEQQRPIITVERTEGDPGHIYTIAITNSGAEPLVISDLTATFSFSNGLPVWTLDPDPNPDWTLSGNVASYISTPITVAGGDTEILTLDKITVTGVSVPGILTADICAVTDCGTVCVEDQDDISSLAPPQELQGPETAVNQTI